MSQSRKGSLIEALFNTAIGFAINYTANWFVLPLFGFHVTAMGNLLMGLIYTVISVVRSYVVRRWFNAHITRVAQKLSGESGAQ